MARTFSGLLFYDATQILNVGAAINLAGDASTGLTLAVPTNATTKIACGLADVKRPFTNFTQPGGTYLSANELQEAFGTSTGTPGDPMGPGFQLTVGKPWGLALIDIFIIYNVGTLAATSVTLAAFRTAYTNNGAVSPTSIVSSAAGPTVVQANPYVFKVAVAQPLVFESTDLSDVAIQATFVLPNTSTASVWGMGAHVAVEYT